MAESEGQTPIASSVTDSGSDYSSLAAHILTPGSSTNPVFLSVVDGTITLLALFFTALLVLTGGNLHFLALLCITLALWASIKWYVVELRRGAVVDQNASDKSE